MKNPRPNLLLYIGLGCPFCTKVTHFMSANQIEIPIKDVWRDDKAKQELIALTGKTQVPCLKVDEQGLLESDDIIQYLRRLYSV